MKKPLKQWSLAIKSCSDCCNCFIIFMALVCNIEGKCQMQRDIFSNLQSFLLAMFIYFFENDFLTFDGSFMSPKGPRMVGTRIFFFDS